MLAGTSAVCSAKTGSQVCLHSTDSLMQEVLTGRLYCPVVAEAHNFARLVILHGQGDSLIHCRSADIMLART